MGLTSDGAVAAASSLVLGSLAEVGYAFDVAGGRWRVRRVDLCEAAFAPYQCVLELIADGLRPDLAALAGASAVLRVERGRRSRHICGIVQRVEHLGPVAEDLLVRVHLVPALALLAHTRDSRIFQEQSIPDILRAVLSAGLAPYARTVRLCLDRAYEPREYCTQYGESDLDFALRLMAEEGIFFFFDQAGEKEELVLVDGQQRACPVHTSCDGSPVPVVSPAREITGVEVIHRFELAREVRATGVVLRDFDWTRPALDLTHASTGDSGGCTLNVFDYPAPQVIAGYDRGGKVYAREEGQLHARLRKEELDSRRRTAVGESDATGLAAGQVLHVACHDRPELEGKYLVTEVEHRGESADLTRQESSAATNRTERYRNRFACVPFEVPYRPPLKARPVVAGPQTALVVGPAGEEIHVDEHGRIRVQFHWDRTGTHDERSSCWLRTAQTWAGAGWGFVFLPRVGMEVVVQFLEGNPDRPLVTGCVYNGARRPPYELPARKTTSGIKTRSSRGGGGSNELRFDDAKGEEEVYLHAQKNLTELVENDHATTVHANQTNAVDRNRTKTVGGDETNTVQGSRTTAVTGAETQTFQDVRAVTVQKDDTLTVATGARTVTVKGPLTETYQGGRATTVERGDGLTVAASNKNDYINGEYNIIADTLFRVTQGGDMLHIQNSATLQSVGDIAIMNGGCQIVASAEGVLSVNAGASLLLHCGAATILMSKDGTIAITGLKVTVGNAENNNISFEAAGTTVSGVKITSNATGTHEIQGALINIG